MLTLLGQPDGMEHDKIFDALVTRFQRSPTWESKMWFSEMLGTMVTKSWVTDLGDNHYKINQMSLLCLLDQADYADFAEYPHFEV